jgi:transposase
MSFVNSFRKRFFDCIAVLLERFPVPCTYFHLFFGVKAYSIDLREHVVAACALPGVRIYQVAAQFRVFISFVDKLLCRQRTTGSVAALPPSGGPAPRLDPVGRAQLLVCLGQQPDATLDEVRAALAAAGGPALSRTAVWRAVESMRWGRKKKAFTPPNAIRSGS